MRVFEYNINLFNDVSTRVKLQILFYRRQVRQIKYIYNLKTKHKYTDNIVQQMVQYIIIYINFNI